GADQPRAGVRPPEPRPRRCRGRRLAPGLRPRRGDRPQRRRRPRRRGRHGEAGRHRAPAGAGAVRVPRQLDPRPLTPALLVGRRSTACGARPAVHAPARRPPPTAGRGRGRRATGPAGPRGPDHAGAARSSSLRRAAEMPELAAASAARPPTTATTRRGDSTRPTASRTRSFLLLRRNSMLSRLRCGQRAASARRTASASAALDIELRPATSSPRARRSSPARVSPASAPPSRPDAPAFLALVADPRPPVPALAAVLALVAGAFAALPAGAVAVGAVAPSSPAGAPWSARRSATLRTTQATLPGRSRRPVTAWRASRASRSRSDMLPPVGCPDA